MKTRKKTLMIGITNSDGGSQRHILELSKRINGCDLLTDNGVASSFTGNIKFAFYIYFVAIWSLMFGKKKYDVLHIHENLLYFLTLNPILQFRYKIVVTVHGLVGFKFYDFKLLWFFFGLALSCADKVITVNKADQAMLIDKKTLIYIPSIYIANGVDLSLYNLIGDLPIERKITFIGRIHEQKGLKYLLDAFLMLMSKEYTLDIIGDDTGPYANSLKENYPSSHIRWRGSIKDREEIVKSLKKSYMIVLPSRWEGLPLTLFESLASSRPVILSDIQAFKSVVSDEVLFFSSENSEDLSQKIIKLLNNPNLANDLGRKGYELSKDYDWNMIAEKTKEIYDGFR